MYSYVVCNPWTHWDAEGLSVWSKLLKFAVKGGNLALTLDGVRQDVQTYYNPNSSMLQKAGAVLSISSEVLPVSVGDAKDALRIADKGIDSLKSAKSTETAVKELKNVEKEVESVSKLSKEVKEVEKTAQSTTKEATSVTNAMERGRESEKRV